MNTIYLPIYVGIRVIKDYALPSAATAKNGISQRCEHTFYCIDVFILVFRIIIVRNDTLELWKVHLAWLIKDYKTRHACSL